MKRTLIWLVVATVAVAVIFVALPMFLSSAAVKSRIEAQLEAISGKQVELNGAGSVSLWPYLLVSFDEVVVRSPGADRDEPPLATVEGLEAKLSLTRAFWGEPQLAEVTLIRPNVLVRIDEKGSVNWALTDGELANRIRLAAGERPQPLNLGRIAIRDGMIDYSNAKSGRETTLGSVTGFVDWPDIGSSINGRIEAVLRDETFDADFYADTPFRILRGGYSAVQMSLRSQPVTMTFDGSFNSADGGRAEGDLAITTPAPKRLVAWFGDDMPLLATMAATTISGNFSATAKKADFEDAKVTVGDHNGEGHLRFQRVNDRVSMTGTLAFDELSLPALDQLITVADTDAPGGQLDLSFLQAVDLDLRLSAATLNAPPFELGKIAAAVILRDGDASFEIGDARALGGSVAGSVSIREGNGAKGFATNITMTDIDLGQLGQIYGVENLKPSGKGDARFNLRSIGTSRDGLLLNLSGSGSVKGRSGSVTGLDLSQMIAAMAGETDGTVSPFSGETDYESLIVKFSIANGTAFLRGSRMATKAAVLELGGKVDLVRRNLALRGTVSPRNDTGDDSASPFFVGGNTSAPLFISLPNLQSRPGPEVQSQ